MMTATKSWFQKIGKTVFGSRLFLGLVVAAIGIEALTPQPFFGRGVRLIQGCGISLVLVGLALRAWASGFAGLHTRSCEIEAPKLVTAGPFAHMRNPIYGGTICLGLGMVFLIGDPWAFVLAGIALGILYLVIVPAEESFLARRFGEEYLSYKRSVPRFLPRWQRWEGPSEGKFEWRAAAGEAGIALLLVVIYAALWGEEYLDKIWG